MRLVGSLPPRFRAAPRKDTRKILADQLQYLFRHGEPDSRHFMYGLDQAGVGQDAVVECPKFQRIRDRGAVEWIGERQPLASLVERDLNGLPA